MNEAKYIIRLDDACPTMDWEKWRVFEDIFEEFDIKPLIAVIPNNEDEKLKLSEPRFEFFWEKVRSWKCRNWDIALHGYNHVYSTKNSGIIGLNHYSEFAGLALDEQKEKIKAGVILFREQGIEPKIWIAPAHSFDKNTLIALKTESEINIISDGFALQPYCKSGFLWVPQQLWDFKLMKKGIWTICLHPNTTTIEKQNKCYSFIKKHKNLFISVSKIENTDRKKSLDDKLFELKFYLKKEIAPFTGNFLMKKSNLH